MLLGHSSDLSEVQNEVLANRGVSLRGSLARDSSPMQDSSGMCPAVSRAMPAAPGAQTSLQHESILMAPKESVCHSKHKS